MSSTTENVTTFDIAGMAKAAGRTESDIRSELERRLGRPVQSTEELEREMAAERRFRPRPRS
jgi:hypothetical protein